MNLKLLRLTHKIGCVVASLSDQSCQIAKVGAVNVEYVKGKNLLSWHKPSMQFSIDASDLKGLIGREWNGREDIVIHNPETLGAATFANPKEQRDREGDLQATVLTSGRMTLMIFND